MTDTALPFEFSSKIEQPSKTGITGKVLLGLTGKLVNLTSNFEIFFSLLGGVALGLSVVCASFVSPAFRKFCLPYIPATKTQIKNIFLALKGQQGTLLDLGSGDGRIVLEAAKRNFVAHGVELNFWLVLYSRLDSLRKGVNKQTEFYCKDLWKFNIGNYDNIVIFGVEQMMADLEKKFETECRNGCNIIACRFPLPNKTPCKTIGQGIDTVWFYKIDKTV